MNILICVFLFQLPTVLMKCSTFGRNQRTNLSTTKANCNCPNLTSWKQHSGISTIPGEITVNAVYNYSTTGTWFLMSTSFIYIVGTYSVLQVVIALQRHTGYFLIQIYLPCTLLVVLSWVGFWLNREATSDRVGLGKNFFWQARLEIQNWYVAAVHK